MRHDHPTIQAILEAVQGRLRVFTASRVMFDVRLKGIVYEVEVQLGERHTILQFSVPQLDELKPDRMERFMQSCGDQVVLSLSRLDPGRT